MERESRLPLKLASSETSLNGSQPSGGGNTAAGEPASTEPRSEMRQTYPRNEAEAPQPDEAVRPVSKSEASATARASETPPLPRVADPGRSRPRAATGKPQS